mgnify:CR=1 FL=1
MAAALEVDAGGVYFHAFASDPGRRRAKLAKAFGISDAAATKDLKLYNELAPDNLIYRHNVFGFVPGEGFQPQFSELAPNEILPMIAANLASASGPYGDQPLYGIPTESLPLPARLPGRRICCLPC